MKGRRRRARVDDAYVNASMSPLILTASPFVFPNVHLSIPHPHAAPVSMVVNGVMEPRRPMVEGGREREW